MVGIRTVPVFILGLGNVGRELVRQILDTRAVLERRAGLHLSVAGVADSTGFLFDPAGLSDGVLSDAVEVKTDDRALIALTVSQPVADLRGVLESRTIVVDTTASVETGTVLKHALDVGCGVILANKHPLSGALVDAQTYLENPQVRYETTVGAGLPVIATLRTLLDTGDHVVSFTGCLSGTLGYVCTQLEVGASYSQAVTQARSLGYSEPDPREDLSGRDVARKALILARSAGWPLHMDDLTVEPLYPDSLSGVSSREFLTRMHELDSTYQGHVRQARADAKVLRYVAHVEPGGGKAGLEAVDRSSLIGALRGTTNILAITTARYSAAPLIISGPGAGLEVTAAGLLGDIIGLASEVTFIATNALEETRQ